MEKRREIFGLPVMFWGLWVTLLILWMGRFVTSFLSMYLVSDMHVSAGVAGTIVSMYGFGGIFGCLYGGALSDRFGRPAMIVIGNLVPLRCWFCWLLSAILGLWRLRC